MSATPILDLEAAPPEGPRTRTARFIGVMVGLALAGLMIAADQNVLPHWNWPPFNGLLLLPALYVCITIHELGHLLAARAAGMRTGAISVGAFSITKSGGRWSVRSDWRMCIGGFFQALTPQEAGFRLSRYAWMVAGGPLASILSTGLFVALFARYGGGAWHGTGTLLWTSLFIAAISVAPFSAGLNKSDGARLWQLARDPEGTRFWMTILAIQTENTEGVRPKAWNSSLFGELLRVEAAAQEYCYCQILAYYRRLDERLEGTALTHLENALAHSGRAGTLRHALFLEAASASATIQERAAQARAWRDQACKLRKPESLHAVEAGIAMCEGRYGDAARGWEAAKAYVLRRRLDSGVIRFALERWADFGEKCRLPDHANLVGADLPVAGYQL